MSTFSISDGDVATILASVKHSAAVQKSALGGISSDVERIIAALEAHVASTKDVVVAEVTPVESFVETKAEAIAHVISDAVSSAVHTIENLV